MAVNTTSAAVDETFAIPSGTETLTLPAGPYLRVLATDVVLGVTVSGTDYSLNAAAMQFERFTLPDSTAYSDAFLSPARNR